MANKIVRYTLTSDGTVPTFIEDGGYFPKPNSNDSPRDMDLIGVTVDDSSEEGLGVLANEAAVKTYLDTYTSDWEDHHPDRFDPTSGREPGPFDQAAAAAWIWRKKID